MKNKLTLVLLLFVAALSTAAFASTDPCVKALVEWKKFYGDQFKNHLQDFLALNGSQPCMVELIAASPQYASYSSNVPAIVRSALKDLTQAGSSVGTGGTTNLVSKGLASDLLSLATGYGALTQSTSNQTTTVSGTLGGLPTALIHHGVLAACPGNLLRSKDCISERSLRILNRFSFGVSFNTSQNSQSLSGSATGTSQQATQQTTFSPSGGQVNQVTGKVVLLSGHEVIYGDFIKSVKNGLPPNLKLAATNFDTSKKVMAAWIAASDPANKFLLIQFPKWQAVAIDAIPDSQDEDQIETAWNNSVQSLGCSLVNILGGPRVLSCDSTSIDTSGVKPRKDFFQDINTFALHYSEWVQYQDDFAETLRSKPVLTFEYDNNRPASQPANSVFRAIYGQAVGKWTLTGNAASSIYDNTPSTAIPGSRRLRDIQIAGEADYDLKSTLLGSGSSAAISYYYQDQTSPAILNVAPGNPVSGVTFINLPSGASQVYSKKGIINIAQAKLTLGSAKVGISFPIAVSWSNRTELVTTPSWKGQVGISYNLDALFSGK